MNDLLTDRLACMITNGEKIDLGHIGAIFNTPLQAQNEIDT